ncbi:hypothetical protein EVAR_76041_1 [Eumeta japonica]|uniref:Uncharacterized protein n=1 Tax=Eumeta variegata TaxID=151549 RepID=A0A4C1UA86_EUMVA|nr:hypothetical protein EVAR_76041_1 [Eumeta japonica]
MLTPLLEAVIRRTDSTPALATSPERVANERRYGQTDSIGRFAGLRQSYLILDDKTKFVLYPTVQFCANRARRLKRSPVPAYDSRPAGSLSGATPVSSPRPGVAAIIEVIHPKRHNVFSPMAKCIVHEHRLEAYCTQLPCIDVGYNHKWSNSYVIWSSDSVLCYPLRQMDSVEDTEEGLYKGVGSLGRLRTLAYCKVETTKDRRHQSGSAEIPRMKTRLDGTRDSAVTHPASAVSRKWLKFSRRARTPKAQTFELNVRPEIIFGRFFGIMPAAAARRRRLAP